MQPETTSAEFNAGDVLCGQWRLESVIGKGGMGTVWAATELKFQRKVAVKTLHPNLLQEEAVRRFEREAQVMARLDHPHVVTLLAFARQGGLPFIVMRHLRGANLRAVIKENGGKLSWNQYGPLLQQLCDALAYIHTRGVVHRDLKLSNIFLDGDGWLTLLDMGLARGHRSTITHTGMVWGTPDFLSPEQVAGEKVLDGRSDLYGLAAVSYLVLSGRYPFEGLEGEALLRAHLNAPRPDITTVAPHVPSTVGKVLQRAMSIAPADRYQTAPEFFSALEAAFKLGTSSPTVPVLTSRAVPLEAGDSSTEPELKPVKRIEAPLRPSAPGREAQAITLDEPDTALRPGIAPRPLTPAAAPAGFSVTPLSAAIACGLILVAGFVLGRCS